MGEMGRGGATAGSSPGQGKLSDQGRVANGLGYRAMKQAPVMETALKPTVLVEVSICLLLPNYVCYFEYQSCKSEGKSPVSQHLAVSILVSLSLWFWEPSTVQQCSEPIPP